MGPGIVMVEFLGMKISCCLVPIITCAINPSLPIKDGRAFCFRNVSKFLRGFVHNPDLLQLQHSSTDRAEKTGVD